METNFITIYLLCLQARMKEFYNGFIKIYNGFYVIKFIFEIADPTICIYNTFYTPKRIYIYINIYIYIYIYILYIVAEITLLWEY